MIRKSLSSAVAVALLAALGAALVGTSGLAQPPSKGRPTWAAAGKRERCTPENCVFAFIDHQTGLMNLVENTSAVTCKNYVSALGKTAKLHNVPVVMTTSASSGPNGPFLPEVAQMFPNAPLISRPGQINAWENSDFVDAIKKTGKRKI